MLFICIFHCLKKNNFFYYRRYLIKDWGFTGLGNVVLVHVRVDYSPTQLGVGMKKLSDNLSSEITQKKKCFLEKKKKKKKEKKNFFFSAS